MVISVPLRSQALLCQPAPLARPLAEPSRYLRHSVRFFRLGNNFQFSISFRLAHLHPEEHDSSGGGHDVAYRKGPHHTVNTHKGRQDYNRRDKEDQLTR